MMMMRLAGKEISPDTAQAISRISELVATLAAYYKRTSTNRCSCLLTTEHFRVAMALILHDLIIDDYGKDWYIFRIDHRHHRACGQNDS